MSLLPGKYGVHSPFVFNLITKVIEERASFYRLNDIELIRKRLLQKEIAISKKVRKEAIPSKRGALLFRLTNYFKPQTILQVGSSMGLSTLYISSYAAGLRCASIEPQEESAAIARWAYQEAARTVVDLYTGDPQVQLPECLEKIKTLDFVFFNGRDEQIDTLEVFTTCMPYTSEHTLFVIDGIRKNKRMRTAWNTIIAHPEVTVTLDLYNLGLVFLNKKLHKRNYKIYW